MAWIAAAYWGREAGMLKEEAARKNSDLFYLVHKVTLEVSNLQNSSKDLRDVPTTNLLPRHLLGSTEKYTAICFLFQ